MRDRFLGRCAAAAMLFATSSAFVAFAPACGPREPTAGACPNEAPPSCPSAVPSWTTDVEPIIVARCNACHGEGGIEQPVYDYTSYQGVYKSRAAILSTVSMCVMPPPDAAAPTPSERATVLTWLVCNAPNN